MKMTFCQRASRRPAWARVVLSLALLASALVAISPDPAYAANPAPAQTYYVTLPETDALTALSGINAAAVSPVTTYFSIGIGVSSTNIYYDQWENGYDSDIANPTNLYSASNPGGTQIWGNGLAADGCAPNKNGVILTCTDGNDVFSAGDVLIPSNTVPIPKDSNAILFDARDKIGASNSIAMARATWAAGSGTLNAFAHEMYATAEWGTTYESPVGTNTTYPAQGYSGQGMFEYSALSVMATQNNTIVQIDANADGVYESSVTLQEGGASLVTGIRQGARVQTTDAAKPIQVMLVTGDIGSNYESRDMNLLPLSTFGSSYWSPVGVNTGTAFTPGPTRLFLYNPSTNGSIYITCVRRSPTPTTITQGPIAARGVVTVDLNTNSGAHCYASTSAGVATTDKIVAIGTVDTAVSGTSAGQAGDWSFTLYPDAFLSPDALVGLGLGKDPTDTTSTQDGSPLWVTPVCDTYVYVDWDNNGSADLADLNGDGDTADTVDGISESTSNNGMSITSLKSVRLFEPVRDAEPYDQSGARVWSRTAANVPLRQNGAPGCDLALAWGQDPRTASAAAPGLDVGTSIPPLRLIEGTKSLALKTDSDGDGLLSPGDIATYNITVKNTGLGALNNVAVYDAAVPAYTTYNTGTTQKDVGGGWTAIPDDGSGTAFPLDVSGGALLGDLAAGATFNVRFDVTLNNLSDGVYGEITNCGIAITGGGTVRSCTTNLVAANDWGDLPDTYGTSLAANGPRHAYSGLILGAYFDRDLQGQPSVRADGDDLAQTTLPKADDEDGVLIAGGQPGWQNGSGSAQVTVTGGPGCLNAWLDFTNDSGVAPLSPDGNFTKTGGYDTATVNTTTYSEHVVQNLKVNSGTTPVALTLPQGTIGASNGLYFRFRLSPTDASGACTIAIPPTDFVAGGEVEDYYITPVDLAVTKTDGLTTVKPGDTVNYTLSVSNTGPGLATGVVLEDTIGANLTYQSSTCGTPVINGSTYSWSLADLAAGASSSCTVTVKVANGLTNGVQLTNYARVSTTALEVNVTNNEASDIDQVLRDKLPNLQITKTDSATQVLAGDTLVYTINYSNAGEAKATGVTIVDVLPANVTYVSSSPAGSLSGSTLTWNIGQMLVGASGSIQVTVRVNGDQLAGAVVLNRVSITGSETDANPSDNSTTDSNTVIAPYVVIEKSAVGLNPANGELTYSINWTNNSTATAANVVIADTLPANTTLVTGSITDGGTESGGVIIWNLGGQAPGASGMVSFKVIVNSGAGGAGQTAPTLSIETGTGSVTVTSRTTAYTSLPWCDSTFNPKCLTYRGIYQDVNGVGPTGWADNPRATVFDDAAWTQPFAATEEAAYWLPGTALDAQWTSLNAAGVAYPNYTFFRQAFCLPLNAGNLGANLRLAGDDTSSIYLNGVPLGQHRGAGGYSTLDAGASIQSGINILAVQLLNNTHGGHGASGEDHSGLLFNLQASYGSLQPFAYAPATTLAGQGVTLAVDENALGGRRPYSYKFDFDDGTVVDFQSLTSQSHTYTTPGVYTASVTARAAYGCTGSDQVTITVLPPDSNLLANTAHVTYQSGSGTNYSGQSGAGITLTGTIGDAVWLDENGNGQQDAGEAGIPNVMVTITNGSVTYTTYTDANGNYVFTNVPVGAYTVSVDTSSLLAGLAANPTYDEDGAGTMHTTSVTLTPGVEHMTADFGYNWVPTADVTGNTGTGAIGDRVWIDADGDGAQDAEEMGLSGVTVELWYDLNGDGVIDTLYPADGTTTTSATGAYIFDGLPAGIYEVRITAAPDGYTLTGDPDQPGMTCTACDNKTTAPIALAPGDVYSDAGFGYRPGTNMGAAIGDQIWLDANANGTLDSTETGIAGVTVALIKDNGDGVYQPGVDLIIATDITDANGVYQFNGVPVADGVGSDDYLVWVNDTAHVLDGLIPIHDNDGVATAGISAVVDLAPAGNSVQDFGYAPAGQTANGGIISDAIFLDLNSNRTYDAGEGLEGMIVRLYSDGNGNGSYDASERLLAQTTTDENGNYIFANLPAGSYVVVVDTATLPGGVTNTVDPNQDSLLNDAGVTLAAGQINQLQDFGYQGTNSVSGTIWRDTDADGFMDPAETGRLAGVTVVLRDTQGDIVATTTTDANGAYAFNNLPNGTYTVDVTDNANVLDGSWKSECPAGGCGQDGYSQSDIFAVTVSGSQTNTTADFGYYRDPAALSGWIWWDKDKNGIQDPAGVDANSGTPDDETGIPDAVVTLNITWPNNGGTTTIQTTSDDNGYYSFGNLLLDENMDGAGEGEPTFTITVANPADFPLASPAGVGGERGLDSGLASGESVTLIKGSANDTYDFGFHQTPLAVDLAFFSVDLAPDGVAITWETVSEQNNAGFNLYRAESAEGPWTRLNETLIAAQAPGSSEGRTYQWVDKPNVEAGVTLYYQLEDIALDGTATRHTPVEVALPAPNAVSLSGFAGSAGFPAALPGLALTLLAAGAAGAARRLRRRT